MDNRRVAKAYRDRSNRARVLPYPAQGGLLSKVKRYFSGSVIPSRVASLKTNPSTASDSAPGSGVSRNDSNFFHPDSIISANTTLAQGSEDSNRILSTFFQEKGKAPLSQVEYEGVMSLLERSKASVTLPLVDDTPERPKSNSTKIDAANSTFDHYSQKVLRKSSMHDASSSSLVAPDYKPIYHSFNGHTRSSIPVKRVYQFSGLPSPYQTRIKAPNFAARKAKRLASAAPSLEHQESSSSTIVSSKPRSRTAASLLSILDGEQLSHDDQTDAPLRPLHNPYSKPRRAFVAQRSRVDEQIPVATKDDITKTIAFSKAEELGDNEDAQENAQGSLFGPDSKIPSSSDFSATPKKSAAAISSSEKPPTSTNHGDVDSNKKPSLGTSASIANESEMAHDDKEVQTASTSENPKPSFQFGTSEQGAPASKATFSFGKNIQTVSDEKKAFATSSETASNTKSSDNPLFTFKPAPDIPVDGANKNDGTKSDNNQPVFSFGSQSSASQTSSLFGSTNNQPTFNFNQKEKEPEVNGANETEKQSKPQFAFGSKSGPAKPTFNFGKESKNQNTQTFSFGGPSDSSNVPKFGFISNTNKDEPSSSAPFEKRESAKPAFDFGSKTNLESNSGTEISKPAFNFGGSKPNENLTVSNSEPKSDDHKGAAFAFGAESASQSKPAFSFGAKSDSQSKPTFDFGVKSDTQGKTSSNLEAKTDSRTPPFSFGTKSEASAMPAFNFGSKADSKEDRGFKFEGNKNPQEKLAFSFGSNSNSQEKTTFNFGSKGVEGSKDVSESAPNTQETSVVNLSNSSGKPKPAFTFGAKSDVSENPSLNLASTTTDKKTPTFSFESKNENKDRLGFNPDNSSSNGPAFTFGAKSNDISNPERKEKPSFSFNSTSTISGKADSKPNGQAAPLFSFGNDSSKKSSLFGSNSIEESKPSISFGISANDKQVPKFSFGTAKSKEESPKFSFGSATNGQENSKPAFSFGTGGSISSSFNSKPSESKPNPFSSFASNVTSQESSGAFGNLKHKETTTNGNRLHDELKFEFPEVKVDKVEVDEEKVKEYESMFKF